MKQLTLAYSRGYRAVIITVILTLALVFVFSACAHADEYIEYSSGEKGFSIKYPPRWQSQKLKNPSKPGVEIYQFLSPKEGFSDPFNENLSILVKNNPKTVNVREYYNSLVKGTFREANAIKSGSAIINGTGAKWITYSVNSKKSGRVVSILYVFAKDKRTFLLLATCPADRFKDYEPQFLRMINSFEIR